MLEKAILVAVKNPFEKRSDFENSLEELRLLTRTAGAKPVCAVTQELKKPNSVTYIGQGKSKELKILVDTKNINLIIVNDQLSPGQERNLNGLVGAKIIDRTALILDIFADHAHSREGKIQVELAQYNYLMPRLKGKGLVLSRLGGGIGTRGPGETKLEVDKRTIRKKIQNLKKQLKKIELQRKTQRKKRSKNVWRISLVGYTNSGKSTLLNALTKAKSEVANKLFSTLDSMTRRLYLDGKNYTVSDTVGFIDKLPTTLIEAFKSTLAEAKEADILIHVVDSASSYFKEQIKAVNKILKSLEIKSHQLLVFNKVDLLDNKTLFTLKKDYPDALFISALKCFGLNKLIRKIKNRQKIAD